jgi:RES domain-containing protein
VVKAGVDPLSTLGSQANGGRYNDHGMAGVLYTSLDRTTAVAEIVRGLRTRGVNPNSFGPDDWWLYEIRVSLTQLLNLEDEAIRSALDVTPEVLVGDDTVQTRRIGNYARENGFQAILAPSAAAIGTDNLVLFLDRLTARPEVLSSIAVDLTAKG